MKQKRMIAIFGTAIFTLSAAAGMSACGRGNNISSDTLQIAVIDKGYGTDWLSELVETYKEKTGKKAEIVKNTPSSDWFRTSLEAGPSTNKVDLYFSIAANYHDDLLSKGQYALQGYEYDYILEDLSDFYEETLDDYGKSLKELMPEYYLDAVTFDGKQFSIPWALGLEGILYNTALFEKYGLSIPRTTDEMFELFDTIKTLNGGTYAQVESGPAEGLNIYPVVYSATNNYTMYAWLTWWAQYEGTENFNDFLEGVNEDGQYTYEIFTQDGRVDALGIVSQMLNQTNGYSNVSYLNDTFTQSQLRFLNGEGFISFNGDWVEREAVANADADEIAFMKTPVMSSVIKTLPDKTITTDEQLCEVIDYVDGITDKKPSYASDADIRRIADARSMACTEGDAHIAYIPAYAAHKEEAKDFLRFWLSEEGQNIQMQNGYGNVAPLLTDPTELPYYASLSDLQKSKFEIWRASQFIGRKYNTPMTYAGGLMVFRSDSAPEIAFGCDPLSASFRTAEAYVADEIVYYKARWAEIMRNAGVSN